jgi:hypothetical protein
MTTTGTTTNKARAKKKTKEAKPHAAKAGNGSPITPAQFVNGALVDWPDLNKHGKPARSYRNTRKAIGVLAIVCRYDIFHDRMTVGGEPINQWAGELSDLVIMMLRQIIINHFGFDPGKDHVNDAASELCLEHRFNPVTDYFDGVLWDGTPRLETWLSKYLGAEDTPLNRAIGRIMLMAAVRRARQPGCKFDHIVVFEGFEGTGKSTALIILAGEENFSDQTILTASDKEQQELVRGVLIFEIADLAGMKRSEVEKVKAFVTRTTDRARPAYGRRRVDVPRCCIFAATTNDDEYLKSQTGNRRFWPVRTGVINLDALRRDRDQLWAEAAAVEAQGDPLVLPRGVWGKAIEQQEQRLLSEPWDDFLADAKGELYSNKDGSEEERIKCTEVLMKLKIEPERASAVTYQRLKGVMARLGWEAGRYYFGSKQLRGYRRAVQLLSE